MINKLIALAAFSAVLASPVSVVAQDRPSSAFTPVAAASTADAVSTRTVYIEATDNFQSALTAAFIKKKVPANVVITQKSAAYTLKSADVYAKAESTGSKVARCLFAYCAGIEGTASVSVQLIRNSDGAVVWAYQVRKGNSGPVGIQSLSEAIAKHIRNDYFDKQK
jgi:TolB-like protein